MNEESLEHPNNEVWKKWNRGEDRRMIISWLTEGEKKRETS